jgi:hemolysin activation/secretion protein
MKLRFPLLLAALVFSQAFAQESITPPLQPRPALPDFVPKATEEVFQLPKLHDSTSRPAAIGGDRVDVRRIAFAGNVTIPADVLAAIAHPYEGRALDADEIETLRQMLTRHYVDAGYINSGATLGPKALVDGVLTFTIMEGRLGTLRLKGLGHLHEGYVSARLVPDEAAALNVDALRERFQQLLADPLFVRAQARIIPDAIPGRAILDVDFERARPYQLTAVANNARVASIGENALGLTGWIRNLSGWGDLLSATWQREIEGEGGHRKILDWRIPLGARGTEFSMLFDSGESTVLEQPVADLNIKSRLRNTDIGLSQHLYETMAQRFTVGINHVQRANRAYLLGVPFSFSAGEQNGVTRIKGWRFWQEYAHRGEDQALVLRSTFLDNRTDLLSAADAPDRQNRIWLGQGHFARKLSADGLQASLRASLQRTGDRLSPLDRMALGGAQNVRGFRENQLIRDQGAVFNADLDYPLLHGNQPTPALTIGLFHDIGQGRNQGESSRRMSATGLTLKGAYAGLRLDMAVALARSFPAGVSRRDDTLQDKGIHFQVSYAFFN